MSLLGPLIFSPKWAWIGKPKIPVNPCIINHTDNFFGTMQVLGQVQILIQTMAFMRQQSTLYQQIQWVSVTNYEWSFMLSVLCPPPSHASTSRELCLYNIGEWQSMLVCKCYQAMTILPMGWSVFMAFAIEASSSTILSVERSHRFKIIKMPTTQWASKAWSLMKSVTLNEVTNYSTYSLYFIPK